MLDSYFSSVYESVKIKEKEEIDFFFFFNFFSLVSPGKKDSEEINKFID
jgi:hypothetical protein